MWISFLALISGFIRNTQITPLRPLLNETIFVTSPPEILELECIIRNMYTSASVSVNVTVIGECKQLFIS